MEPKRNRGTAFHHRFRPEKTADGCEVNGRTIPHCTACPFLRCRYEVSQVTFWPWVQAWESSLD